MNRVLTFSKFNIGLLFQERTWIILSWALFGMQVAVYGSLMSKLIPVTKVQDYFFFYSIGLIVIIVFDSGSQVGRHFVEHAHEGELPYFLSLPISRRGFLISQALYGVVNTMVRILPPLLVILYIVGRLTPQGAFFAMIALFLLSLGMTGIMISFSFIAFKSIDIYSAVIAGLSALLVRFSTVFYPLIFLPNFYSPLSLLSPLTYGADLTRWFLGFDPSQLLNPTVAAIVITSIAVGTLALSAMVVDKVIEGVKAT